MSYAVSELYEIIIQNSYDAILATDQYGRVLIANRAALNRMGLPSDQVLGRTVTDLMNQGVYSNSTVEQAMKRKEMVTGLINIRGKNHLSTSLPLFDDNGDLVLVLTNNRSDSIMNEFAEKYAYEQQQHELFQEIASYFSNQRQAVIAESPQMKTLVSSCFVIAKTDSTVILYGESGVGKEVIAGLLHSLSLRQKRPFISVNCAAIPPDLFESELFGYKAGAFTGADRKGKTGLIQMANQGTLFLDEIGELPLLMQSKLLRLFENGEIYPVGSSQPEKVDVRIISATNRDLLNMVKEKTFREDLYYRLQVLPLYVPPLRERPDDISALSSYYLNIFNKRYNKHVCLTENEMQDLLSYHWPGNIRELRNVIERKILMKNLDIPQIEKESILFQKKEKMLQSDKKSTWNQQFECTVNAKLTLEEAVSEFEIQYIQNTIKKHNGNLTNAAQALGIHRTTLYRKRKPSAHHQTPSGL